MPCQGCNKPEAPHKVVCNNGERRNPHFHLCGGCKDKYRKINPVNPCFLCHQHHKIRNGVDCCICFGSFSKEQVIEMGCPKKNGVVKRFFCTKCAKNYNFREKGCPYCREFHDPEKWDMFVRERRKLFNAGRIGLIGFFPAG